MQTYTERELRFDRVWVEQIILQIGEYLQSYLFYLTLSLPSYVHEGYTVIEFLNWF